MKKNDKKNNMPKQRKGEDERSWMSDAYSLAADARAPVAWVDATDRQGCVGCFSVGLVCELRPGTWVSAGACLVDLGLRIAGQDPSTSCWDDLVQKSDRFHSL